MNFSDLKNTTNITLKKRPMIVSGSLLPSSGACRMCTNRFPTVITVGCIKQAVYLGRGCLLARRLIGDLLLDSSDCSGWSENELRGQRDSTA